MQIDQPVSGNPVIKQAIANLDKGFFESFAAKQDGTDIGNGILDGKSLTDLLAAIAKVWLTPPVRNVFGYSK